MRRAILVLAVMVTAPRAQALDPWTWQDTAWEAGFAAAVAMDVGQTRYALRHGHQESNPVLGSRPSDARIIGFAATSVALHAGVSLLLPAKWRRPWQAVTLGLETGAVGLNAGHVGLRVAF